MNGMFQEIHPYTKGRSVLTLLKSFSLVMWCEIRAEGRIIYSNKYHRYNNSQSTISSDKNDNSRNQISNRLILDKWSKIRVPWSRIRLLERMRDKDKGISRQPNVKLCVEYDRQRLSGDNGLPDCPMAAYLCLLIGFCFVSADHSSSFFLYF